MSASWIVLIVVLGLLGGGYLLSSRLGASKEKNKTLEADVKDAKKSRNIDERVRTDPKYRDSVRDKFR